IVYLFDGDPAPLPLAQAPEGEKPLDAAIVAETKAILDATKVTEGYAVVLGAAHADFALALARQSNLQIIAMEADEASADAARHRIDAAGIYGTRVSVHSGSLEATTYPKHFANLVIAPKDITPAIQKELERLRRPYGGIICHRGSLKIEKATTLAGAGDWTHQNGSAANTLCSDEEGVTGKRSMFWFREVVFEVANRHGQGPAPLIAHGFMVVGGVHGLCCLDAYNGRKLWDYKIENLLIDYDGIHHDVGIGDTGSPFCLGGDSVYVKNGPRCLRIDLATGKLVREIATPVPADAANRNWGYLAFENGLLFGSVENAAHNVSPRYQLTNLRTESVLFFAVDPATGAVKWQYQPKGSLRHNAIAIAGERVYLIDRPIVEADRVTNPRRDGKSAPKLTHNQLPPGTLLAIEAATGKVLWENRDDVWGTQLAVSAKHGVLLMNYKAVRHNFFELPSEAADASRVSTSPPASVCGTRMRSIKRARSSTTAPSTRKAALGTSKPAPPSNGS
ncbi:MAG: PQQ-binding-like beta-propeller repeat protein, partial [Prosthecobacter sp.]